MSKKDYRELDRAIISCTPPPPTPKKLTAYEALQEWADKYGVGYVEWESEWTGNPCISFNQSEETFVFAKDGSFIEIE
jgi:hypothetical protein